MSFRVGVGAKGRRSPAKSIAVYRPSRPPAHRPLEQAVCREVWCSYAEEYWMVRSSTNFLMWLFLRGCHSSHELVIATGQDIPAGTEPVLDVARAAVVLDLVGRGLWPQEAVAYA